MKQEDIIRMAREAGGTAYTNRHYQGEAAFAFGPDALQRFAFLVAAAEREACANLAEKTVCDTHIPTGVKIYGSRAADAIRARGQQ